MVLDLIVYGCPAPQGSKRFVGVRGGKGLMVESSKKVRPWRQDVKAAAIDLMQAIDWAGPLDGPLKVSMTFTVPKPLSAPKRRRTYPDRKPDLSKLVRSTEDALTDAGFWRDDARVVEYVVAKVYPGEHAQSLVSPGVRIVVDLLTDSGMAPEASGKTPESVRNLAACGADST